MRLISSATVKRKEGRKGEGERKRGVGGTNIWGSVSAHDIPHATSR